jgi:hypothetical protein
MNIRCAFCQTPYTLSRVAMLDALQEVDSKNLSHYDAHCPRCRRATRIPRQRLEMAMPNWREELKAFEKEMKEHPQQEAPLPAAEPVDQTQGKSAPVAEAASVPEPAPVKKAATKPKPAAKPAESKPKTAARGTTPSAEKKKSTDRKTSTKGTSKKSK